MSVDELRTGYRKLLTRLYNPEFVETRNRNFRQHLRRNIREKRAMAV
jgi:hypothetical protein